MSIETGRFRRSDRLLDSRDFRRVLRRGRRRGGADLVVYTANRFDKPSNSGRLESVSPSGCRLGITASRKVGNAVVRNRFKRRVRAWFRQHRSELERDRDLIVIARKSGAQLSLVELDGRLSELLEFDRTKTALGKPPLGKGEAK